MSVIPLLASSIEVTSGTSTGVAVATAKRVVRRVV